MSHRATRRGSRAACARLGVVAALLLAAPAAFAQAGVLLGTTGDDTINGTPGADTIFAHAGNDRVNGAAGNDDIDGGPGADDIRGGSGTDAVLYGDRTTPVAVTLDDVANDGAASDDNVHSDVEQIFGGTAGDRLNGNGRANLIDGGGGDDSITDGGGADRVYGGAGDDVITTFDGADDVVDCGSGTDTLTADRADLVVGCEKRLPAPRVTALVTHRFSFSGGRARVETLTVTQIPGGARVEVRCRGGCPVSSVKMPGGKSRVALASLFRKRLLGRGATIEVRITKPGSIGRVRVYRMGRDRSVVSTLCLPPGGTTVRKQC